MNKKEQVKKYIISSIICEQFKIDEMIPSENKLCNKFKMSRSPVREALKELSYSNWIQPKKGKGYYVQGLDSYKSYFIKEAYNLNLTKIRDLRKDEQQFLKLIHNNEINNPKIFAKEYLDNQKLIIKSINLVTNDYLFYLSNKEIQSGFIKALLKHKIEITHQNWEVIIINLNDKDVKKLGWQSDYPVVITSLYIQTKLISKSILIIKKSHFHFHKKFIF